MKINIFGVGRSGTKAVQLYTSLLLLEKHENLTIVYEPYLWKSRMGKVNTKGIKMHSETPLFINQEEGLSNEHQKYIKKITNSKGVIVTKSIRACGRIHQFNNLSKPDLIFIVYRDLYKVLESITPQQWNFFTGGPPTIPIKYQDFWPGIVEFVKKTNLPILPEVKQTVKNINASIDKNAFIWYLSNVSLLSSNTKIDMILNQNDLHGSEIQIQNLLGVESALSFADIRGSQIRKNEIIKNIKEKRSLKTFLFTRNEQIGDLVQKVKPKDWQKDFKEKSQRIKVLRNDLYDTMNDHINELVQMKSQ